MANKPKIGIVGGGAVGLTYAYFLADVADIVVKTRGQDQANTIKADGIQMVKSGIKEGVKTVQATTSVADLKDCDVIIVTVKSYDTADVVAELSQIIGSSTPVVSLQNGLEAFDVLKAELPNPERVFAAITYIGARRSDKRTVHLGKYHRTIIDAKVTRLINTLQATRYGAEASNSIQQAVWDKMILNTGQNALSAVTNLSVKQMLGLGPCLQIANSILDEFQLVAQAEGITFEGSLLERLKANWTDGDDFYPSMWQDLHKGKRTEIDAINGAISKLGSKHDIATPYNDMITALIKALESAPGVNMQSGLPT